VKQVRRELEEIRDGIRDVFGVTVPESEFGKRGWGKGDRHKARLYLKSAIIEKDVDCMKAPRKLVELVGLASAFIAEFQIQSDLYEKDPESQVEL